MVGQKNSTDLGVFGGAEHDGRVLVFARSTVTPVGVKFAAMATLSRNENTRIVLSAVDLLGKPLTP